MVTVNGRKIIDELIANDGYYSNDPRVWKIVEYTNAWGKICYGISYINEDERY